MGCCRNGALSQASQHNDAKGRWVPNLEGGYSLIRMSLSSESVGAEIQEPGPLQDQHPQYKLGTRDFEYRADWSRAKGRWLDSRRLEMTFYLQDQFDRA